MGRRQASRVSTCAIRPSEWKTGGLPQVFTHLWRNLSEFCANVVAGYGGPRSVVAVCPLLSDANAARPSNTAIWLRLLAALGCLLV